jgi:hypothetical protein
LEQAEIEGGDCRGNRATKSRNSTKSQCSEKFRGVAQW